MPLKLSTENNTAINKTILLNYYTLISIRMFKLASYLIINTKLKLLNTPSFLTATSCDLGKSVYITKHKCHATKLKKKKKDYHIFLGNYYHIFQGNHALLIFLAK